MSDSSTGTTSGYREVDASYFEKRTLRRSAGVWGLWGIGIAAVISGDFSGWNVGLASTGWGGLLVATIIIAVMFFLMIFSIGEMSAAMPHTGGAYSFARAAMGPWGGFVTGLAESIEYVVTTAVVVLFSASYANSIVNDLAGHDLGIPGPVWWLVLYVIFIGLNSLGASVGFRFALVVAIISMAVLLLFAVLAFANGAVDFSKVFDIDGPGSSFLPFGATGIFVSLPFAIWFFLGIEELPLAAEESHNPTRDIPRASVWGVITLTFFGLLILFLNPAVTGSKAITVSPGDGDEPLLAGFRVFLPDSVAALLALFALIGLLASLQGIMFAYGRNLYSLSRAGYYPSFLSLTSKKNQTPWVALIVGGVIGFFILLLVQVLGLVAPQFSGAATGIILFIAVFGAVISYIMQMISFVMLRRKYPKAVRPWKSPTGVPGAIIAGVIAVAAFLGIVLGETFRPAVVTFLIIFVVGIVIFAAVGRRRLVLAPEEEYAMSGGLHRDPAVEDYAADQREVLDGKP